MHQRIADKLALEADLRRAIGAGDLSLMFQPMFDLEGGDAPVPFAFEALARWVHPERGPISPTEFIALAEETGHIEALTLFVLEQSLRQLLFIPFDGLASLYVISALFGLFQGGIVPSYAIIVREHFPPAEAGARVGAVLMCTLFGMALGGWLSGKVFDLTGSYTAAFVNGVA
jgi:hypothetical protein